MILEEVICVRTGERIKVLRKMRGMQRKELAELLGVTQSTLWRWENGDHSIREDRLREIAYFLKIPVAELMGELAVLPPDEEKNSSSEDKKNANTEKFYEDWFNLPVFNSTVNLQYRLSNLDCDRRFALPHTFVGAVSDALEKKPFVVAVEGDSMAAARICGDSFAVINPAEEILDGDAALVKVGSRFVIRWLYWLPNGGCDLRAASPHFPNMTLDASALHGAVPVILGKVMWSFSKPQVGL